MTKKYDITCPKCNTNLKVKIERETIEEPVKGEYEDKITVEIDKQSTLDDVNEE